MWLSIRSIVTMGRPTPAFSCAKADLRACQITFAWRIVLSLHIRFLDRRMSRQRLVDRTSE
jgi:hypothetical protein